MIQSREVVLEARKLLGTKWRHQGRCGVTGIDCAGLIIHVGKNLGLLPEDYDFDRYGRRSTSNEFVEQFDKYLCKVHNVEEVQQGDVVVFLQNSYPGHCGIVSSRGVFGKTTSIIHANGHPRVKKVVEQEITPDLLKSIHSFYRYKEI